MQKEVRKGGLSTVLVYPEVFAEGLHSAQLFGPVFGPMRLDVGRQAGQSHVCVEIHEDNHSALCMGVLPRRIKYGFNPSFTEHFVSRQ